MASVEIRVPTFGESVVEATVARILKQVGEFVKEDEPVVELESDKATLDVASASAGVLEQIVVKEGDTVRVKDLLATVNASNGASAPAANGNAAASAPVAAPAIVPAAEAAQEKVVVSPVAGRVAQVEGVNLAEVRGSGLGGKVVKQDVESFLQKSTPTTPDAAPVVPAAAAPRVETTPAAAPQSVSSAAAVLPFAPAGDDRRTERRPMSRRRLAIAANLKIAQNTAAMLTTFNEVDMSAVMAVRKRRNEAFEKKHGVKIGFMSFFTKAVIGGLKTFPLLNAEIDGSDLLIKHFYDIGIAVGAAEGLVVPVVRDADRKTFAEIEKGIGELAGRARDNKLSLADMQGGSFTITNGGIFGSLMSTPILNYPQVGILGMHKIQERPVVENGEIAIRPMMYLALSYDHRIVDGGEAVRFLVKVKELLEDPESLLLEG